MSNYLKTFFTGICSFFLLLANQFANAELTGVAIYQVSETEGNFIQAPLNHDIYRYSSQADLRDLLVVDSEKMPLPYRLVSMGATQEKVDPQIQSSPLAFYPVAADASPESIRNLRTTQIKVQGDAVQVTTSEKEVGNKNPEFFLIDVSNLTHNIDGLRVDWVANGSNEYLQVDVEASSNLQQWNPLGQFTLVQIQRPEQSIKRNFINIAIEKNEYEFVRIRIKRGAENLQITSIAAEQVINIAVTQSVPIESWKLGGVLAKDQNTVYFPSTHSKTYPVAAWEFIREEVTPINTVDLALGNSNYGDNVKIFSRSDDHENWNLRYQGIWFNAQVGEQWQKSDAVNAYRNSDKYWRIELNENSRTTVKPDLLFGWQPIEMQIIANGKSPYTLIINNQNNDNQTRNHIFNQMISAFKPEWKKSELVSLGTKPEAVADIKKEINWKQWIFWASLVSAVLVLLIFSLRLFKQFKQPDL